MPTTIRFNDNNASLYQANLDDIDTSSMEYDDRYILTGGTKGKSGQASRELERRQDKLREKEVAPKDTRALTFLDTPSWLLKKFNGDNGFFTFDIYTVCLPKVIDPNAVFGINVAYKLSYTMTGGSNAEDLCMTQYICHPRNPNGLGNPPLALADQAWNVDSRNNNPVYGADDNGRPESSNFNGDYAIAVQGQGYKMNYGYKRKNQVLPPFMVDTPQEYFEPGRANFQDMYTVVKDKSGNILDGILFGYAFDGQDPVIMTPRIVDNTVYYFKQLRQTADDDFAQ